MRTRSMLLVSLLALLAGCQQESSVSQESAVPAAPAPVAEAPAVSAVAPATPVASEAVAVSPAPVVAAADKVPAKVSAVTQKPVEAIAEKPAAPAVPAAKPEPVVQVAALSEMEGLALAKKSNCLNCHAIDKKVVGPAWKDVAAKYRGDAGAEERLANVIAKGGRGNWGGMAMPANPQVSEADRRSLARFVLSLK